MAAVSDRLVTVFGGTGFLGRRVVRQLRRRGFGVRVASRHADRSQPLFDDSQLQLIKADIHDGRSVAEALADAYGAVNAVSLYLEHGRETFHSVHVESAQRLAIQAQRAGVERLIHVSGIGADPRSQSLYIRKRGEAELAVKAACADALIIRPAVMFGPDDALLTPIVKLLKRLPIYPMFGRGRTRLQPAYVEDVAQAVAMALQPTLTRPITFECAGPYPIMRPMTEAPPAVRITETMLRSCLVPAMTDAAMSTVSPGNGSPTHSSPTRPATTTYLGNALP